MEGKERRLRSSSEGLSYCIYHRNGCVQSIFSRFEIAECIIGADWLQGPYVYSLYHEQYKYPEHTVALLFVTGFTSAGFFAPIVGDWADQKCVIFPYWPLHGPA